MPRVIEADVLDNWIRERCKPNDLVFESTIKDVFEKLGHDWEPACERKEMCCDS